MIKKKKNKSIKYTRQKNGYSCGPVGIINVLKWAGYDATYENMYDFLEKECRTTKGWGTYRTNITRGLRIFKRYIGFTFKRLVTFKEIEKHLNNGGAVLLEYFFKEDVGYEGHYEVLIKDKKEAYLVINGLRRGPAKQETNRKEIASKLKCKMYRYYGSPSAWLINKKENVDE